MKRRGFLGDYVVDLRRAREEVAEYVVKKSD